MGTPNNELLIQLRGAISSWTAEVGTAQRGLSQQIDSANAQLTRLLTVLQERQQLTTALARSNEELERLRQSMQQGQLPAGAMTRYTVTPTPAADAATRELDSTISRLQTAVQSWTSQVAHSQGGLLEQFATANRQLTQLLEILTEPAGAAAVPVSPPLENPATLVELEQLRHENTILSSEVHALNIEMETFRREQEVFAAANLASETERVSRHRRDMERLEATLATREAEFKAQQQAYDALTHEADSLRREAARLQVSEDRLQSAAEQQRHETAEHMTALSALSREMEALRRAFLGEDVQLATHESEMSDDESLGGTEALARAEARIAFLEAQLTHQEIDRDEVAVLNERIEALKEQLVVLEERPTIEAHASVLAELEAIRTADAASQDSQSATETALAEVLEVHIADLEQELAVAARRGSELESRVAELESQINDYAQRPTAEEHTERTEQVALLESRIVELESQVEDYAQRPTTEEHTERTEQVASLESRIVELASQVEDYAQRPTADELAERTEQVASLESRIVELESQVEDYAQRPTAEELAERIEQVALLESRIVELESQVEDYAQRPTAEEHTERTEQVASLESRIVELESQVEDYAQRPTTEKYAALGERAEMLEQALDQLRADSNAASGMAAEAMALREQLSAMQLLVEELDSRPEAGVLEEAERRILVLEEELQQLEQQRALATDPQLQLLAEERAGLQQALSAMESELSAMKRREEETMATARTLLDEMETHRTYEAAQATALSQSRNEAARLQDALTERQQQVAQLTSALAAAEAERDAGRAAAADFEAVARIESLELELARLEEEHSALAVVAATSASLQSRADAQALELESTTAALEAMRQEVENLQTTLEALREQSSAERNHFESIVLERDTRISVLEADLPGHAESLMKASALEEALRAACARVDELEANALEAQAAEAELDPEVVAALSERETEVQRLNEALEALREAADAGAAHVAALEKAIDDLTRQNAEFQNQHQDLNTRIVELEAERERLVAAEAGQRAALEEARKEADVALTAALEQEQALALAVSELGEKSELLAELSAEKESISQEAEARGREIQEAMAQMSQVVHERDELTEELEAEKGRRDRVFPGGAGVGKGAVEALELKEERARQQEILLSELAQPGESRSLGDILVHAGILSREQLSEALDEQQNDPTQLLGTILIERDYTTDDAIAQAVACQLEKPVVNPMEVHISLDALEAVSRDLCTWHVCIPLRITPDRLVVAMANPLDESAILKIRDISQREITAVVATPSHIMGAIDKCYGAF